MHRTPRPIRLSALPALGAGLLLVLSGSGSLGQSPSPAPGASVVPSASILPGGSAAPSPSGGVLAPPEVTVTDRGDKPRAALRFTFQAGTDETMVIDMTQTATSSVDGGAAQVVTLPTIRYTFSMHIDAVDAAGTATVTMGLTSVEVQKGATDDQATVDRVQSALDPLVGYQVMTTVDDRGRTLSAQATLPEGLDPALAQQMSQLVTQANQLSVTLPLQRVGAGATWTSSGGVAINGMTVQSDQTTTLVKQEGDTLTLKTATVQTAEPGPVTWPGVPAGWTTTLTSLDGKATLRQVVDLTQVQVAGGGSGTLHVVLELSDGTNTHTSDSTADSRIKVSSGG